MGPGGRLRRIGRPGIRPCLGWSQLPTARGCWPGGLRNGLSLWNSYEVAVETACGTQRKLDSRPHQGCGARRKLKLLVNRRLDAVLAAGACGRRTLAAIPPGGAAAGQQAGVERSEHGRRTAQAFVQGRLSWEAGCRAGHAVVRGRPPC